mmetsp:Transcript_1350/g.2024  ORF Transcript_1350/g.2024 Transcript_1350/m.2024 type:complete len:157 (-) Transcript_1350:76-546(-)
MNIDEHKYKAGLKKDAQKMISKIVTVEDGKRMITEAFVHHIIDVAYKTIAVEKFQEIYGEKIKDDSFHRNKEKKNKLSLYKFSRKNFSSEVSGETSSSEDSNIKEGFKDRFKAHLGFDRDDEGIDEERFLENLGEAVTKGKEYYFTELCLKFNTLS